MYVDSAIYSSAGEKSQLVAWLVGGRRILISQITKDFCFTIIGSIVAVVHV